MDIILRAIDSALLWLTIRRPVLRILFAVVNVVLAASCISYHFISRDKPTQTFVIGLGYLTWAAFDWMVLKDLMCKWWLLLNFGGFTGITAFVVREVFSQSAAGNVLVVIGAICCLVVSLVACFKGKILIRERRQTNGHALVPADMEMA